MITRARIFSSLNTHAECSQFLCELIELLTSSLFAIVFGEPQEGQLKETSSSFITGLNTFLQSKQIQSGIDKARAFIVKISYELSAPTIMETVVGVSASTESAVVSTDKSKIQVPTASSVTDE